MISIDEKSAKNYLKILVNRVYKILPMYENLEQRKSLFTYIQSLLYEFKGVPEEMNYINVYSDFSILYYTLEQISNDSLFDDDNREEVKREVFKCISLIKRIYRDVVGEEYEY